MLTTYGNIVVQEKVIADKAHFDRFEEPKWVEFCKKHGFNRYDDAFGKIYDLYLIMCGQGLV